MQQVRYTVLAGCAAGFARSGAGCRQSQGQLKMSRCPRWRTTTCKSRDRPNKKRAEGKGLSRTPCQPLWAPPRPRPRTAWSPAWSPARGCWPQGRGPAASAPRLQPLEKIAACAVLLLAVHWQPRQPSCRCATSRPSPCGGGTARHGGMCSGPRIV